MALFKAIIDHSAIDKSTKKCIIVCRTEGLFFHLVDDERKGLLVTNCSLTTSSETKVLLRKDGYRYG